MNGFRTRTVAALLMTCLVGCDSGGGSSTGPAGAAPAPAPPSDLKAKFEKPAGGMPRSAKGNPAPAPAPAPPAEKKD